LESSCVAEGTVTIYYQVVILDKESVCSSTVNNLNFDDEIHVSRSLDYDQL
jgi:hypothetical protein